MKDTRYFIAAGTGEVGSPWHACARVDRTAGVDGNTTLCGLFASPVTWIYSMKYDIDCPDCVKIIKASSRTREKSQNV